MSINDSILNSVGLTDKNIKFLISDNSDFNEWVTMGHDQQQVLRYRTKLIDYCIMQLKHAVQIIQNHCLRSFVLMKYSIRSGLKSIFETGFKRHSEPRLPSTAPINH